MVASRSASVEDDHRRVPAKLEVEALHVGGGERHDPPATRGRAGEGDHPRARVGDERLAQRFDRSRDVVQHAVRQPGVQEALDGGGGRQGRFRRGLDDDRTARCQRGSGLPAEEVDREIPGDDGHHDAERLPDHEAAHLRRRRRTPLVGAMLGELGVVAEDVGGEAELLAAVWQRLALLARQRDGDRLETLAQQVGAACQDAGAFAQPASATSR